MRTTDDRRQTTQRGRQTTPPLKATLLVATLKGDDVDDVDDAVQVVDDAVHDVDDFDDAVHDGEDDLSAIMPPRR